MKNSPYPYGPNTDPVWAWACYRGRVSAAELVAMDAWHEQNGAFPEYPPDMWWACGFTAARNGRRSPYWWPLPGDRVYDPRTQDVRTVLAVEGPWAGPPFQPTDRTFNIHWYRPGYYRPGACLLASWRQRWDPWSYGGRRPRAKVWPVRAPWLVEEGA